MALAMLPRMAALIFSVSAQGSAVIPWRIQSSMTPTKLTAIGSALLLLSGGMSDAGTSLTHVIGLAACGLGCIVAALLVWRGEAKR